MFISLVYLQSYHIFLSGLTVEVGLNDGRMQRDVFSPANPQLQRAERTMIFLDLHVCVSIWARYRLSFIFWLDFSPLMLT